MYSPDRLGTPVELPPETDHADIIESLSDVDKASLALLQDLSRNVSEIRSEVKDIRDQQEEIDRRLEAIEKERDLLMARMGGAVWLARAIFVVMVGGALAFLKDLREVFG